MKKLVLLILLIAVVLSCFSAEKYAVLIAPNRPIEHQGNFRELLAVWNDIDHTPFYRPVCNGEFALTL